VHCKIGYSRTAAVVACYLLASGKAHSADEAMQLLRKVRPSIVIRPEARRTIVEYAQPYGFHWRDPVL
jgi:protein-tyrosine phosphatase